MAEDAPVTPRRIVVDVVETAADLPPRATTILDGELARHEPAVVRALVEGSGAPEARAVLDGLIGAFSRPDFPVVDGFSAADALLAAMERADREGGDGPVPVLMAPMDEVLWEWVDSRVGTEQAAE